MRRFFIFVLLFATVGCAWAQFNVDRVLSSAEIALHYEDYPLSIAYDNQIIALRPYLVKPWQLRSAAKFCLQDYSGAEADASEALRLNPYIEGLYDLRALARVYQHNWSGAVEDYAKGIEVNPKSKEFWYNRAVCEYNLQHYETALEQIDTINSRWAGFVNAYTLKAEVLLQMHDTIGALKSIDRGLELNQYDSGIWYSKGMIHYAERDWKTAGLCFSKVVHLKPKHVPSLLNLALCYASLGEMAMACSKYTLALEFDPNSIIAHYNRGILYAYCGRYEEALIDFNYVLQVEPGNVMALKNKELLLERNGNADRKSYWTISQVLDIRHRGDNSSRMYASLIMDDEDKHAYYLDFLSEYRNRRSDAMIMAEYRSMFMLSYVPYNNGSQNYLAYDKDVEKFIAEGEMLHDIYVTCGHQNVNPAVMRETFKVIDSLSVRLGEIFEGPELERLYMQRAVAYSVVQDYSDAIDDLTSVITINPSSMIAYWQRAVCQTMLNGFNIAQGLDVKAKSAAAMNDICKAIELSGADAYLYYNRALIHAQNHETGPAIEDYSNAIRLEPNMAEAYFNRGMLYVKMEDNKSAIPDLQKSAELGIKDAYTVLNRIGIVK